MPGLTEADRERVRRRERERLQGRLEEVLGLWAKMAGGPNVRGGLRRGRKLGRLPWKETPCQTVVMLIRGLASSVRTNEKRAPRCCALHRGGYLLAKSCLQAMEEQPCSREEEAIMQEGWQCGVCHALNPPCEDPDDVPVCIACDEDIMCHGILSLGAKGRIPRTAGCGSKDSCRLLLLRGKSYGIQRNLQ